MSGANKETNSVMSKLSSVFGGGKQDDSKTDRKAKTKAEKTKEANQKKWIVLIGLIGVAMVFGAFLDGGKKEEAPGEISSDAVVQIKDPDLNQSSIVTKFNRDIKDLQEKQKRDHELLEAMKGEVESLRDQQQNSMETVKNSLGDINRYLRNLEAKIKTVQKGGSAPENVKPQVKMPAPDKPSFKLPQNPPVVKREGSASLDSGKDAFDLAFGEDVMSDAGTPKQAANPSAPAKPKEYQNQGVYAAEEESSGTQNVFVGSKEGDEEEEVVNPYAGYLAPGFVPAAILTGVSANTSQTAQANPAPVMMRIQGNVQLAGDAKYKLKSCFIFGSATGNMSEERAHIRLANISCVDKKNKRVLEGKIKGYAVDSDGIFGVRGKLVERRADAIRNMFLAGGLEGLANVGSQAASGGVDIGGITQGGGIDGGAIASSSAMKGFANAAGKLAEFYLKEAQAMFPVVEVPPGRKITLVIVEGTQLLWRDVSKSHVKQDK